MLEPFYDEYATGARRARGSQEERPNGDPASAGADADLKEVAQREHLNYEVTKLLSFEEADQYGPISTAQVGTVPLSGGRKFAAGVLRYQQGTLRTRRAC